MSSDPPDPDAGAEPDLEAVAADLDDAERALRRLGDGSYWTDEVTGEPLPDATLDEHPTARRAVYVPFGPPVTAPHGIPRVETGTTPEPHAEPEHPDDADVDPAG
jgi:hypothetical protein